MKKTKTIVYAIFYNNVALYVGQTTQPLNKRINSHYHARKSNCPPKEDWEVVSTEVSDSTADYVERYLIKFYTPIWNIQEGGKQGFTRSEQTKKSISVKNKNNENIQSNLKEMSEARKKPIIVYKEGVEVGMYDSVKSCSEKLGLNKNHVSSCALGKLRQHKGYTFKYVGGSDVCSS